MLTKVEKRYRAVCEEQQRGTEEVTTEALAASKLERYILGLHLKADEIETNDFHQGKKSLKRNNSRCRCTGSVNLLETTVSRHSFEEIAHISRMFMIAERRTVSSPASELPTITTLRLEIPKYSGPVPTLAPHQRLETPMGTREMH